METQHFVNLLNNSNNYPSKFTTKRGCFMGSEANGNYAKETPIKFITNSIASNICDYSDDSCNWKYNWFRRSCKYKSSI